MDIRDGELTLHFPALSGVQKLKDLQARLSVHLNEEKQRFQVQQLTAHGSPADLEVRARQGTLQKLGYVVQLDDVRLQTNQTTLVANGVLPGGTEATNLNLAALRQQGAWHSDLNLQLRIDGTGTSLQEWHGMIQLEFRPSHLREIVLHPSYIDLEVKAQRVQVQRFDLDTSIAHTTVYGMFDLTDSVDMQYALTANLAEWQPLVGMKRWLAMCRRRDRSAARGRLSMGVGRLRAVTCTIKTMPSIPCT